MIEYSYRINSVFNFDENTVHGQAVPLYFDSSLLPVYQTLLCGSTDYLIPKKCLMFPGKTVDFLNNHKDSLIHPH